MKVTPPVERRQEDWSDAPQKMMKRSVAEDAANREIGLKKEKALTQRTLRVHGDIEANPD
jgi:hypothetical protein